MPSRQDNRRAAKLARGESVPIVKSVRKGEIIYASEVGRPARLELRATWDQSGYIRQLFIWLGLAGRHEFRFDLGFDDRIAMAVGICPELGVAIAETRRLFDKIEGDMPDDDDDFREVYELIRQVDR